MKQHVIFLNGPPRCGKDTIGRYMQTNYRGVVRLAMATYLKAVAHSVAGLDRASEDYFEGSKDKPSKQLPYNTKTHNFYTPREWYIFVAEKMLKPNLGSSFFGTRLLKTMEEFNSLDEIPTAFVITDSGFAEEAEPIIQHGGGETYECHTIHIYRKGYTFASDSRNYWINPNINHRTINNTGTVDDLYTEVDVVAESIGLKKY